MMNTILNLCFHLKGEFSKHCSIWNFFQPFFSSLASDSTITAPSSGGAGGPLSPGSVPPSFCSVDPWDLLVRPLLLVGPDSALENFSPSVSARCFLATFAAASASPSALFLLPPTGWTGSVLLGALLRVSGSRGKRQNNGSLSSDGD